MSGVTDKTAGIPVQKNTNPASMQTWSLPAGTAFRSLTFSVVKNPAFISRIRAGPSDHREVNLFPGDEHSLLGGLSCLIVAQQYQSPWPGKPVISNLYIVIKQGVDDWHWASQENLELLNSIY